MKTITTTLLILFVSISALAQKPTSYGIKIPKKAQDFISTNFPQQKIIQATKDRDVTSTDYDVFLDNNVKLEFDRNGKCKSIENKEKQAIPASAVPANIISYTKKNYPDSFITKWEQDDKNQEVKMSNGLELKFDKKGNFLRIDD